ncbi:hypothetical protein [Aureimonas ureilytica]|nr:hypothetical protein [Aureimonas ureilytica]
MFGLLGYLLIRLGCKPATLLALGLAAVIVALLPSIRAKRKEVFVEDD